MYAMPFVRVRPGEIISAELMNVILDKLEELEDTVNSLGQLNRIKIERFLPKEGVPVGQYMTIEGANFMHPPSDNLIQIAGKIVEEYTAPNTSRILTFRVPDSIEITNVHGEPVTITVSNEQFGSTQGTYNLFPPLPPAPAPYIETVTAEDGLTERINTGESAFINGGNFSDELSENEITITVFDASGNQVVYPKEPGDRIEIKSASPERVEFIVPDIEEIEHGDEQDVVVKIIVNARWATKVVTVHRSFS